MRSEYLFVALIFVLSAYEVYALLTPKLGDTISEIMWRISRRDIVPLMFGLLAGHFWLQRSIGARPFLVFCVGLLCGFVFWRKG